MLYSFEFKLVAFYATSLNNNHTIPSTVICTIGISTPKIRHTDTVSEQYLSIRING